MTAVAQAAHQVMPQAMSQPGAAAAHLAVGVARVSQPVHQALLVHILDAARTLAGVKQGWC